MLLKDQLKKTLNRKVEKNMSLVSSASVKACGLTLYMEDGLTILEARTRYVAGLLYTLCCLSSIPAT